MKRFIAFIYVGLSIMFSAQAQQPVLFGTTSGGNGGIFKYESKDNTLQNVYRFKNSGIFNRCKMVHATNGLIYGVADGGPYGYGIIYSLDPVTLKYKIEKNFRLDDGEHPISLVQGKDGKLYGTTDGGGPVDAYLQGTIFSFDPATSTFEVLLNFGSFAYHAGELTAASDGLLYGVAIDIYTVFIYSFNPETRVIKAEAYFSDGRGSRMIAGPDGNLYGVIASSEDDEGNPLPGRLFSYSLKSKKIDYVFDFNSESRFYPKSSMMHASDGKFYLIAATIIDGSTQENIFCFDPYDNSMKVIYTFDGVVGSIVGGLTEGSDGKLYGMSLKTLPGQNFDFSGTVFYSIDKSGSNYRTLRSFDHSLDNNYPNDGDLIVVNDKFYGIAVAEKSIPYTYIFSYQPSNDLFQKIIQTNLDKGSEPSNLLQARDGRFYGITTQGGAFERGGIFSFNPASRSYTMLLPFNKERGTMPLYASASEYGLVQAGNGKLYGLTTEGGAYNSGVIFSYDPEKARYVVLKNFTSDYVRLTGFGIGNDGNLYSTLFKKIGEFTFEYLLFSINPVTGKYKEVIHMNYDDGPFGILMPSSDGILYACTPKGIFSFDAKANSHHLFLYPDKSIDRFSRRLIEAADHKLYGKISPLENSIYSFDPSDGSFSEAYSMPFEEQKEYINFSDLTYASDGLFYGTTYIYSLYQPNLGTLFSFNPETKSYKLLRNFDQNTGGNPLFGPLVELNTSIPPIVSITDRKMFEGERADLTVSLNRISMNEVALNYRTVAGTAIAGKEDPDYIHASGELIIPAGETSTTLSVSLLEDELEETREWFTVVLRKANEAPVQLGDSIGIINIKNGSAPIIPPGGEIITIAPMLSAATESIIKNELVISAAPNPSSSFFSLFISGIYTDRVSVIVTNMSGQILDKFDKASNQSTLTFGHTYKSGSYFLMIVNGEKTKVIKLIKTSK